MKRKLIVFLAVILTIFVVGFLAPYPVVMPVQNATSADWHADTFWYEPWGKSGVHKGIDIFATSGTPVLATTSGLIVFQGELALGGNVVVLLGPRWQVHYYAHLETVDVGSGQWVTAGELLGSVGTTGNAVGKQPHLHYSVVSLVPQVWRIDSATQGWKKMFYLDPAVLLTQ